MTFNLGGLAGGFAQGMEIGSRIKTALNEDAIAKVRAQGIAEARAMQAAGTPGVTDNGDVNNLTSNPQASTDPAAAQVNTNLAASPAMQGVGQPAASENGMSTAPVAAPEATPSTELSGTPLSSADPAAPAASGLTIKGGKRFMVGDAGFDDMESARAHAAKQAPDIHDLIRKTLVPKMQDAYLAQGDIAKADAWGAWAKSKEGEKKAELWGKAFQQSAVGNFKGAADALAALHKDLDDGRTYLGQEDVKDDKGNLTGFNMKYKDDATGEEKSQFVDKHALIEMGLSSLSPQAMFEQSYKAQTSADTMAAKARLDSQNDARTTARQLTVAKEVTAREKELQTSKFAQDKEMEDKKAANKMEEKRYDQQLENASVEPKIRAKVKGQMALLRESGMTEDEVKASIPTLVGIEPNYKKTTDPTERRAIVTTELLKNPLFTSKKPGEQNAMVDQYISIIDGTKADAPAPAAPAAAGGVKPRAPAAAKKPGGIPVYDPATKSMIYR